MKKVTDLDEAGDKADPVAGKSERTGFLPIATNWFDRVFVSIYLFVALELLWMRFLEQAIPLAVCHVIALALGALIVWRG
jgi:predicted small integral membrane protein